MLYNCHIQQKKRFKKGRFFKVTTLDSVIKVEALDQTHCKLIIFKKFGLCTKIFNIFEDAKQIQ